MNFEGVTIQTLLSIKKYFPVISYSYAVHGNLDYFGSGRNPDYDGSNEIIELLSSAVSSLL